MSDFMPDYRAKTLTGGGWVEGDKQNTSSGICIFPITDNHFKLPVRTGIKVNPATLCRNTTAKIRGVVVWQHSFVRDNGTVYEVLWDEENYRWYGKNHNNGFCVSMAYIVKHCDFAGNRHDNPELLEGAK